jgi:hypothetical protein
MTITPAPDRPHASRAPDSTRSSARGRTQDRGRPRHACQGHSSGDPGNPPPIHSTDTRHGHTARTPTASMHHRRTHPIGAVPVLVADHETVAESTAFTNGATGSPFRLPKWSLSDPEENRAAEQYYRSA